jgi:predicted AAA+ superfamily ATPase
MTEYFRSVKYQIEARLSEKQPLIQVVVGPRQVGKSTAIKQVLNGQGIYFTADSPTPLNHVELENQWNSALQLTQPILAIDEVQKINGWAETIKKL